MSKRALVLILIFLSLQAGCATAHKPKPKTIGDRVGAGIDHAIIWTSEGVKKLFKRNE